MVWLRALNRIKYDILVLLAMLGYATYYYNDVRTLSGKAINMLLVEPVYWILLVCALALIFNKVREARTQLDSDCEQQEAEAPTKTNVSDGFYRRAIWFGVTTFLYVVGLDLLGFVSSSLLYLACLTYLLGARSVWLCIIMPALVVGFLYVSMVVFLQFSMPQGLLF